MALSPRTAQHRFPATKDRQRPGGDSLACLARLQCQLLSRLSFQNPSRSSFPSHYIHFNVCLYPRCEDERTAHIENGSIQFYFIRFLTHSAFLVMAIQPFVPSLSPLPFISSMQTIHVVLKVFRQLHHGSEVVVCQEYFAFLVLLSIIHGQCNSSLECCAICQR